MRAVEQQLVATLRKKKVNQLARSIRKKYLSLKLGKSENDETLNKLFKPVVDPLERIIKNQLESSKRNEVPTVNPIAAAAATATATTAKAMKSLPQLNITQQSNLTPPVTTTSTSDDEDDAEVYKDAKTFDDASSSKSRDENITHNIDPVPELLKTFMMENLSSKDDKIDKIYGPRYIHNTSTWKMGAKIIKFDKHGNISTGKRSYKGTPGLYQLIFYKKPQHYDGKDVNLYKYLLNDTGAHLNSIGNLKSSKQHKYLKIIKPLVKKNSNLIPSTSKPNVGSGLSVDKLSYNRKPIEYRYWDDPNELVERLKLLIAAKDAGNSSVHNEIVAIINELKEADIIRDK